MPLTDRLSLDRLLFTTLLLTVPCYLFLVFCAGFLPVGTMIMFVAQLATSGPDLAAIAFAIPIFLEAGVYAFLLRLLSLAIIRRLPSDPRKRRGVVALIFAGCVASAALPINLFDCMDGHGPTRCSALRMYFGWMRTPQVPESTLYSGARCGDFGW